MDAITTALTAANKSHKHTGIEMPERAKNTDYFEVQATIDYQGKIEDRGNVVVCGLNPSTPVQRPDHTALIALIQRKLEDKKRFARVSLVIDNTIEIDGGDHGQLETILQALAQPISEGRLQILLAKSYQKYGSHGTGKIMAGNVTQIHAGKKFGETSRFIDKADQANNYTLDEAQLMTHMVAHGHRDELGLIQHAADNADLLDQMWPGDHDPVAAHQRGLPFVIRGMAPMQLEGPRPESVDPLDAATMLGAEFRASFGFQNTSAIGVVGPDGPDDVRLRINAGQESAGELTEKFYALGQLVSRKQREQASTGGSGEVQIGMPDVMGRIHAEISQFRRLGLDVTGNGNYARIFQMVRAVVAHNGDDSGFASKIASFLHFAATLLAPTGAEAQPLLGALSGFLTSEPSGLSPAMTRQLAVDLLKLTLVDLAAIAAHLPAILDAARRVPPHVGLELFRDRLREPIFAQLGDDVRRALIARLLDHLDPGILVELLNTVDTVQPTKAKSLRDHLDTVLAKPTALDDGGGLLAPDVTAAMTTVSRDTRLSLDSTGTYQLE